MKRQFPMAVTILAATLLWTAFDAPTARAQSSTTTTTTIPPFPTTTTLDVGTDVTGGGRFHGGFGNGGFDIFTFQLLAPTVLLTETSDGNDHCSGDTIMELRRDGTVIAFDDESGPGQCSRLEQRLVEAGDYELKIAGYLGVGVPSYVLDVEFVETTCGNGGLEPLEGCDDGNLEDGDCCSAACTKEPDTSACDNGLACDGEDSCLGGACSVHTLNPCPGADGDGNCAESCSDSGEGCTWPDPEASACSDGLFCNGADKCTGGECTLHAGDPCRGADGDGHCNESCKESIDTCSAADPNATVCDDGLFCNGSDTCFGGVCSQHTGNPCTGADGDANCSESCSETADSCEGPDPFGSPCTDGLFCTGADSCSGGTCSVHAGSGCRGADGDVNCHESCNEAAKNCSASDPDGSGCNDGAFCNGTDQCSGGSCLTHAGNPCPGADGDGNCAESCNEGADACTAADPNASPCNDALFCNGADSCSGGVCSLHAGSPCPGADGDADCAESCNEATDACTAADPNASPCDDGLFCTGTDTCSAGSCSMHAGSGCAGADGDGNCAESCNEFADDCTAADTDGVPCNDGVFCNGADTCSGGSCSQHAGNPCPGADGDGDCAESCDESGDACTAADADATACNDGLFCNGTDTCSAGNCSVHTGDPCPGGDGDENCSESCNENADNCGGADPDETACNDGLFCNGADTCAGGFCTEHQASQCPGADGDDNCAESCSDIEGGCGGNDPAGSPCDDGVFCNGIDTCLNGACAVHAGDPCSGPDGDGDCSESCDESANSCSGADAGDTTCDDGLFCNGVDTCSNGACTVHAGDPCSGPDGDGDCSESCDETADACSGADPGNTTCDDGLFCNGEDTCAQGACSLHEGDPCTGPDGDSDCSESCDEGARTCSGADPQGTACSDADACTAGDACDGLGSCTGGSAVDCDDEDPCTTDSCLESEPHCSNVVIPDCAATTTTTTPGTAMCGDANDDGKVSASDALIVLKAAVGGPDCDQRVCVCDVNGMPGVTASDALSVLRRAVGTPGVLTCDC